MYGNNYNPFIMRGYMPNPMSRGAFSLGGFRNIFRGLHTVNWSGMLNNFSRTLGVVREAIPVVKEVGPMIRNASQMIKIASVFKDETDSKKTVSKTNTPNKEKSSTNTSTTKEYHNEPNFFL